MKRAAEGRKRKPNPKQKTKEKGYSKDHCLRGGRGHGVGLGVKGSCIQRVLVGGWWWDGAGGGRNPCWGPRLSTSKL